MEVEGEDVDQFVSENRESGRKMFNFENFTQKISSIFMSVTEKFVDLVVSKTIKMSENLEGEFSGFIRFLTQQF